MADPMRDRAEELMEEFQRTWQQLTAAQEELAQQTTTVTSKDRMVTVTIGSDGDISDIGFNTTKFRRMAPTELSSILVETIRAARAQALEQAEEALRPLLPDQLNLKDIMAGEFDLDEMFNEAIRTAEQPIPGMPDRTFEGPTARDSRHER